MIDDPGEPDPLARLEARAAELERRLRGITPDPPPRSDSLANLEQQAAELERRLRNAGLGFQSAAVPGQKLVGVYWVYGGDGHQVPIAQTATAWPAASLQCPPSPPYGLLWAGSHNDVLHWWHVRPAIVGLIGPHGDRLGISALLTDETIGDVPAGALIVEFDESPLKSGQRAWVLHRWLSELTDPS